MKIFDLFRKKNKVHIIDTKIRMLEEVHQYCGISFEDFLALSDEERINLKFATLRAIFEQHINEGSKNENI